MILLTTVHDPDGKLAPALARDFGSIKSLYDDVIVEATTDTHLDTVAVLYQLSALVNLAPVGDLADVRRVLLWRGLKAGGSHFHFCDLDRLLFWYATHRAELRKMLQWMIGTSDFIVIGRTQAALLSHPVLQRTTENFINRRMGRRLGQPMDFLAASRVMSADVAKHIINNSRAKGPAGVDVEWPLLASDIVPVNYLAVDGLAYESDTFGIRRPWGEEWAVRIKNLRQGLVAMRSYETYRHRNIHSNARNISSDKPGFNVGPD